MISGKAEPTKKKKKIHESPSSFTSLPEEIVENILARVSRWKYPSLSLVSKRFHSLLSSMDIYKTRSQIGANETCVYVLSKLPNHPRESWFSLRPKPNNKNRAKRRRGKLRGKLRFKRDSCGFSVAPIPSSYTDSFPELPYIETFGSDMYIIGGPDEEPSSSVRIFDCRSHTWRDGPNMTVARENARSTLLDEKIYVIGGCDIDVYYASWIEVFDLKTQSWTSLPGPGADDEALRKHLRRSNEYLIVNEFQGKLYVATDEKDFSYDPKNGTWRETSSAIYDSIEVLCKMGDVMYCCTNLGYLMWYVSENDEDIVGWRKIKGLGKLREHWKKGLKTGRDFGLFGCGGGQLLVMWDPYPCIVRSSSIKRNIKIRYAKISLESRSCDGRREEVWGKVECVDVLTFPVESYEYFSCVAVSV